MKQQDDYIKFLSTVERTKDGITLTGPVTAGGGTIDGVIWYPRPERLVVDVAQYAKPDSRDARIVTLETALRHIRTLAGDNLIMEADTDDIFDAIYNLAVDALVGTTEEVTE